MNRLVPALVLLISVAAAAAAPPARTLEIYFIDVEGGQATLLITPDRESLLIDAGYARNGRDAERIVAVAREAGLDHLDYLLVTHYHPDHVGGVPGVAASLPVGTFIDYGAPLGIDRMTAGGYLAYQPVRALGRHIEAKPGDRLPLKRLDADVVSAGGLLLTEPLRGGGGTNPACSVIEDFVEDGTENYRSIGVMFQFGAFRFLDLGDLSGNTLTGLACPKDLLGTVSAFLIAHHGAYDSNVPALYAALRPHVAIMNNGVTRGGSPATFATLHAQPGMDLWQLHVSENPGARNAPEDVIANLDDGTSAYWLKLTASEDGSFRMVNGRTGLTRAYAPRPGIDRR
ncbi:MAG: MBL fold metallo-hydrolase [Acidobacteriota bacterium]